MTQPPLRIEQVVRPAGVRRFVDVPWHVYDRARHPQWIPPLRIMVRQALDTRRDPFWRRADRALFVAHRGRDVVGRIAAIENRGHNDYHQDRVGFFGFFECREDDEAAAGLFAAAAGWLRERGLTHMRGPMSPSTNHECGLLVDGFEHEPAMLTPWHPRYYGPMVERAGLAGIKDLLGYHIPMDDPGFQLPPQFETHAARAMERGGISFRDLDLARFDQEIALAFDVYNTAWEDNWGFFPMTRDEFMYVAGELRPLLVPEFAFFAEVHGKPAGFMLVVPDYNQVFKRIPNGRLFPTGLLRLLLGKSRLRSGRVILLGVKREFRTRSIFQLFGHELYRRGRAYGATGAEASWVLEDNALMTRPMEAMGAPAYRRWRIYERPL